MLSRAASPPPPMAVGNQETLTWARPPFSFLRPAQKKKMEGGLMRNIGALNPAENSAHKPPLELPCGDSPGSTLPVREPIGKEYVL
jgi:hypothetical protein